MLDVRLLKSVKEYTGNINGTKLIPFVMDSSENIMASGKYVECKYFLCFESRAYILTSPYTRIFFRKVLQLSVASRVTVFFIFSLSCQEIYIAVLKYSNSSTLLL